MKIIVMPILCTLAVVLTSCSPNKETTSESTDSVGKYIYRDDNDIHHINPRCLKLRHGKDDNGHEIYAMHPMDTSEFVITEQQYFRVCSRCVSEQTYEHILRISKNNLSE